MNGTDCLSVAHQDAYNAKILHRDFSPGNIIIGGDRRGLLIDWDLSKPLSIVPETPRRATRTVRAKIDIRSLQ
jgi:RIO-like serine/threonine protein kinase